MHKTRTQIVKTPDDLSIDDLKLNYALLALCLAKLMHETNTVSVRVDINDKDDPEFNLSVNWNADEGIGTVCTTPASDLQ